MKAFLINPDNSVRKTRLYLAGPMRGKPDYNFPAFHAATRRLREWGFEVWSPAENDVTQDGFDPTKDKAREMSHYMKRDLPEVCHADAVAVLPGWEHSEGARLEVHVCRAIGHPVIDAETLEEIPETVILERHEWRNGGYVVENEAAPFTQAEAEVCDVSSYVAQTPNGTTTVYDTKPTNPKDIVAINKLDMSLFPETAIAYGALGMTEGSCKYGGYNYRPGGVLASVYIGALKRHIAKYYNGEWEDDKTNVPHLASALCCIAILIDAHECGVLRDDRPPKVDMSRVIDDMTGIAGHLKKIFPNSPPRFTEAGLSLNGGEDYTSKP